MYLYVYMYVCMIILSNKTMNILMNRKIAYRTQQQCVVSAAAMLAARHLTPHHIQVYLEQVELSKNLEIGYPYD